MELKVVDVDRKNRKAKRVTISTEGKVISFILIDGDLFEISRIRMDGRRIIGPESLSISSVAYNKATRTAAAILRQEARG